MAHLHMFLILCTIPVAIASIGDGNQVFQEFLKGCRSKYCSTDSLVKKFEQNRPVSLSLLRWDCDSECKYSAMWQTVERLQAKNLKIQQFYGKWPFIRIFGIQEPASAFFSLLNGFGHVYMILKLRKQVPRSAPMFYAWHVYSAISIHAWFWSTVFHARDTTLTEKMDYFSAFSLNLSGILMISIRSLAIQEKGTNLWVVAAAFIVLGTIFWRHVSFLNNAKRFDYGYNMKVNLALGLLNSIWWVAWCLPNIYRKPYLKKAIICIVAADLLLLLELGDFPPLFWTFDAHSLWHAGTFPLIFIWYRYVVADCRDLLREQRVVKTKKGV